MRRTDYDAARARERMLAAGWPDQRSIRAALIEPVEAIVIDMAHQAADRFFERSKNA